MLKNLPIIAGFIVALSSAMATRADIFEWEYIDPSNPGLGKQESSTLAPDGAGVDAVPNIYLGSRNLTMAYLIDANLSNADLSSATLADADLTRADVRGASFVRTSPRGFTSSQLYSTASYQAHDLTSISLGRNDLSGWNFAGQNLFNANFQSAVLANANLNQSNLSNAIFFFSRLADADLRQANLNNTRFTGATLINADLSQADLSNAVFEGATLTDMDMTGTDVHGTDFSNTTSGGFSASQLYSTASYQAQDLTSINLGQNDLSGWSFAGQKLINTSFHSATLTNTNLSGANIRGANFTASNLVASQLYSTASYQAQDLSGIHLGASRRFNNLVGWDFSDQNLTNSNFFRALLPRSDLTGADLRGATFLNTSRAIITNLIRPDGAVDGLHLPNDQRLLVRDYDGDPDTSPEPTGPIPVSIRQQFIMDTGGELQLLFEADPWDSTISFEPGIDVSLGGVLNLVFTDDVDLFGQVGRTLDLFDWTGVSPTGAFTVESPYTWDLSQLYSTGEVTLLAVPEPSSSLLLLSAVAFLSASRVRQTVSKEIRTFPASSTA